MLKIEREYNENYGDIPKDYIQRLDTLMSDINYKREKRKLFDEVRRILSIKKKTIKFTLYLTPKATPRPRAGQHGVFYVKGASDNRRYFAKYYEQIKEVGMIVTPCTFDCTCYLPIPKSMPKFEKVLAEMGLIPVLSKPDWDNLAKTYCDMIQGTLLYDDALIYQGSMTKKYSTKPRIEISITYNEEYESEYNKNKMKKKGLID